MSATNNALFGRIQMHHLFMNNLVQWGDHLSVDHPGIDAQHKAIFELGSKVYESWRTGAKVGVLRSAVDKLAKLLEVHFAYEERLLAEIGYKELAQHAAEHASMLHELREIQERFQTFDAEHAAPGGSILAPGWQIMQFILGFSIGHVSTSDMCYYQTLMTSRDLEQGTAGCA